MKKLLLSASLSVVLVSGSMLVGTAAAPEPAQAKGASLYTWKASVAPNYVKVTGKAKVAKKPTRGKIVYSSLDRLGRTRTARGNITYKLVADSAGWRESMTSNDPSGWTANRRVAIKLYNGGVYRGYFWNRSHLIADSLGGHAQRINLVTGTRMQNVGANDGKGGMAYCETKVRDWLYAHHGGSVYYRARPVYRGSELVCRSVVVDMRSSDGSINQRVIVYNAANGYKINYKTGSYRATGAKSYRVKKSRAVKKSKKSRGSSASASSKKKVWVTATGVRYHRTSGCSGLRYARSTWRVTLAKARSRGLTPCKICY